MFRIVWMVMMAGVASNCQSQVSWDGGAADGLWATPANWTGDVLPGVSDDVVLDNIHGVAGSYAVILPSTAVMVRSLRITPTLPDTIKLIIPPGNTITANAFVTTGVGYTLMIDANGSFENNSGAASGTNLSIADSIRINDGGRYVHRMAGGHAAIVQKLSTVQGTERGIFMFDVPAPSYTVSLTGRTYGTLVFSSARHAAPVVYSGTGVNPLTVRGDLIISDQTSFSMGLSAETVIGGNCRLAAPSSIFNLQNGGNSNVIRLAGHLECLGLITRTGSGTPQLQLCGNVQQQVSVQGSIQGNVELNVNNPSGITLRTPVTLPYKLILTNGKVSTSSTNLLTMADNSVCTGGSEASFVNGPLSKMGNQDFRFPIGRGAIFAPAAISNVVGEQPGDCFVAEYHRSNPQSTAPYGPAVAAGIDHASYVEYWTITQTSGVSSKRVSIGITAASFCSDLSRTYVGRWNNIHWTNEGAEVSDIASQPPYETGMLTSINTVSGFVPGMDAFTAVTDLPAFANSLPVDLLAFEAVAARPGECRIRWRLSTPPGRGTRFILQRALALGDFKDISQISGDEFLTAYETTDRVSIGQAYYYRLKVIDGSRTGYFSKIAIVAVPGSDMAEWKLIQAAAGRLTLVIDAPRPGPAMLFVMDLQGRIVQKISAEIRKGAQTMELRLGSLPAGVYLLSGFQRYRRLNTIRFISN